MYRKLCEICNKNLVTVNYKRKDKVYYRTKCYNCIKKEKENKTKTSQLLKKSGYVKKLKCDRCGFQSKTTNQTELYYIDGNEHNVNLSNLRTHCLNCDAEIKSNPTKYKNIIADF